MHLLINSISRKKTPHALHDALTASLISLHEVPTRLRERAWCVESGGVKIIKNGPVFTWTERVT
jgi:hypothetical protein